MELTGRLASSDETEEGAVGAAAGASSGDLQVRVGGLRAPEQGEAAEDTAKMVCVVCEGTGHENDGEGEAVSLVKSAAAKREAQRLHWYLGRNVQSAGTVKTVMMADIWAAASWRQDMKVTW